MSVEPQSTRRGIAFAKSLLALAVVTVLPLVREVNLWANVWGGERARAWDGTGHFALAQIYNQSIFPNTFGWTNAYFGGMPFPNFYPPLFYLFVAFIDHLHLTSFAAAFKLVLALPIVFMPAAIWALASTLSQKDRIVATAAGVAILPMLIDYRLFHPVGLTHAGTFLIGLYSQPLGFVLLICWYVIYTKASQRPWPFALASILLALTVLANFFSAITAFVFVIATLVDDLIRFHKATNQTARGGCKILLLHVSSPIVALCLALFWLVPMVAQYSYFVTRPQVSPLNELVPPAIWIWYLLAALGFWQWRKRSTLSFRPFLMACSVLAGSVLFASIIAPAWFPLQTPRFLSTLNFLLAVPVGFAIRAALARLATVMREYLSDKDRVLSRTERKLAARQAVRKPAWLRNVFRAPVTVGIAIVSVIAMLVFIQPANYDYIFYTSEGSEPIDGVLQFAKDHRDGRYLVEVPFISRTDAALDGRAINSYLGSQGNEALSVVFREASPDSIFFNPLAGAFAESPDNFGISTVLADDLDFVQQPYERHIDRARFVGVRYLVIATLWIKNYLIRQEAVGARHDFGVWSVFELRQPPLAKLRVLKYRPALVVSSFSLKGRQSNGYDFVRWAEEQFNDDWFDVLLARSPETKIDRLADLNNFGALVIDTYDFDDERIAFEKLRNFATHQPLILLSSESPLFNRIAAARSEFPLLEVIQRQVAASNEPLNALKPTKHYGQSPIREEWRLIRSVLERTKTATNTSNVMIGGEINQNEIKLDCLGVANGDALPVLVAATYHPNWRRSDGGAVYAATPFFILTFVNRSIDLSYSRGWFERLALWISAISLLLLCGNTIWWSRRVSTRI